jgi:integrase
MQVLNKGLRARAVLAVLLGCGLRRSEVEAITFKHIEQRNGRWCIVDLAGKHGRVRTVPMPTWVKVALTPGRLLLRSPWDSGVRQALKKAAEDENCVFPGFGPHSLRRANLTLRQEAGAKRILEIIRDGARL